MHAILEAFGVDIRLLIIQAVNFGLLLLALWYFLYTPVLRILNERQEKIAKGVHDAEEAAGALTSAEEAKKGIIAEAHHASADITKMAEKHAEERGHSILVEAETRAEQIEASARQKAEEASRAIQADAEREIAQTAILATEKLILEKA